MTIMLLHLSYDDKPERSEDWLKVTSPRERPVEEMREIVQRMLAADGYMVVGEFDVADPEDVFRITENGIVTPSWSRQPPAGVRPLGAGTVSGGYGYRSSMVGDIAVVDGHCHIVATFGFRDLGPLPDGVTLEGLPRPTDNGPRKRAVRASGEPKVDQIDFDDGTMIVTLNDNRVLRFPVARFSRLAGATDAQLANYVVMPMGVHWPELDEDLSTKSMIRAAEEADRPDEPTIGF